LRALEKANAELREQLGLVQADHVKAVALLEEITRNLAEMTGRELEIQTRQMELAPATYESEVDLREQILADLDTLEERLEESREKLADAAEVVSQNAQFAVYQGMVTNLQRLLDERDRVIANLKSRMETLDQEAAALREEVDQGREKISELLAEQEEMDEVARAHRELIQKLGQEIGAGYCFVGLPEQIDAAVRRGEIRRRLRTYHVPEEVLLSPEPPRIFQPVGVEQSEISLGHDLKAPKILSVHKQYKDTLFYFARNGDETVLRIKDPFAFWRINRYLIVQVRQ
jgi:hypothetical protein